MKHVAKIQVEFMKISSAMAREWWHRLLRDEQVDYIRSHPGTKLRVRAIDIPIGAVQHTKGQTRLLTPDRGWIYYDDDEQQQLRDDKAEVDRYLESQRYHRNYRSATDLTEDEMLKLIDELILEENLNDVSSLNRLYRDNGEHKYETTDRGSIIVPMRADKDRGSGDYSDFEQMGSRPRLDV